MSDTYTFLGLNIIQWFSIIGIPSAVTGIGTIHRLISKWKQSQSEKIQEFDTKYDTIITGMQARQQELISQVEVLMNAQQAQMRKQLLDQFHYYTDGPDGGWISEEHLEEWEDQYQAYHALGSNGVLDARRDVLMRLPNRPPEPTIEIGE